MNFTDRLRQVSLGIIVLLVLIPTLVLAQALSFVKIEAEQGTLVSATSVSDTNASGGAYVNFGTATPPPTGSGTFSADFATASDFYDRFWTYTGNYCTDGYTCRPGGSWPADHDHSSTATTTCSGPTISRTVDPNPHSDMIYWCAPGGTDTGHVMTAFNLDGYGIIGFTPRQAFNNVTKVCYDINRTDNGGGKWNNVAIVPEAKFLASPNGNPQRVSDGEGPYRLDYVVSNEFSADNGPGDFNLQDLSGIFSVRFFRSLIQPARSGNVTGEVNDGFLGNTDRATRYKNCITENTNNTVTISRGGPNGNTTTTISGELPSGKVYVIFQDDAYSPDKHDGTGFYTWHWDNVLINYVP